MDMTQCPFIETLSFGSDIHIRCNHTHLTFAELNVSHDGYIDVPLSNACLEQCTELEIRQSICDLHSEGSATDASEPLRCTSTCFELSESCTGKEHSPRLKFHLIKPVRVDVLDA